MTKKEILDNAFIKMRKASVEGVGIRSHPYADPIKRVEELERFSFLLYDTLRLVCAYLQEQEDNVQSESEPSL